MQDIVLIIDFMNYVHRCRVGNLNGEHVLTFNFFRNLRATVDQFKPAKLFFALEGHPQHRYDLFSDYKANRIIKTAAKQSTIDQVIKAADDIQKFLLLLPITLAQHSNFEADDIIFTLCKNMSEENIIVISSDTDCIQLLQHDFKSCKLYNPIKKEYLIAPEYPYVAFKSLTGDKSDNIPAILKPKKALDTISNPELFKKFMEVEENRANFNINRQLIEFRSVPLEEIEMQDGHRNFSALHQAFVEMKFESITNVNSWDKYCKTFDCLKY